MSAVEVSLALRADASVTLSTAAAGGGGAWQGFMLGDEEFYGHCKSSSP